VPESLAGRVQDVDRVADVETLAVPAGTRGPDVQTQARDLVRSPGAPARVRAAATAGAADPAAVAVVEGPPDRRRHRASPGADFHDVIARLAPHDHPSRAQPHPDPPAEPVSTRPEAMAPPTPDVELADQLEQPHGSRVEVHVARRSRHRTESSSATGSEVATTCRLPIAIVESPALTLG
jgi:hypothetical protein